MRISAAPRSAVPTAARECRATGPQRAGVAARASATTASGVTSTASGARTMRWASTASASAWTSSGSTWSRPWSSARAFAARSSSSPARGLAPSSTRGSVRVRPQQRDDVGADRVRRMDAPRRVLRREHVRGGADRLEMLDPVAVLVGAEHRRLGARVGIAERETHHEAVDLRLGQRVGALELDRVLRRQDDERTGQLVRVDVDADATLLHALQQARLRLGRRAVDLVDDHDVREDRARPELEDLVAPAVDVRPDDVGRQQVRGALHARELEAERARDGARERRLPDARGGPR